MSHWRPKDCDSTCSPGGSLQSGTFESCARLSSDMLVLLLPRMWPLGTLRSLSGYSPEAYAPERGFCDSQSAKRGTRRSLSGYSPSSLLTSVPDRGYSPVFIRVLSLLSWFFCRSRPLCYPDRVLGRLPLKGTRRSLSGYSPSLICYSQSSAISHARNSARRGNLLADCRIAPWAGFS